MRLSSASPQSRWVITDLGTLGSEDVRDYDDASDINERGGIVGSSHTAAGYRHACLWRAGRMLDLVPPRGESYATAVNDRGQVVGTAGLGKGMQAFLWQNGNRRDLNTLSARYSYAVAISERGQVVGRIIYKTAKRDVYHAFSWWNRPMVDLGTLGARRARRPPSMSAARSSASA